MPDHIHWLISEPERGTPSTVMQVVKQRYARRVLRKEKRSAAQGDLWPDRSCMSGSAVSTTSIVLERTQANRETTLHASQSGEARTGVGAGAMGMEQLPQLCLPGRRPKVPRQRQSGTPTLAKGTKEWATHDLC